MVQIIILSCRQLFATLVHTVLYQPLRLSLHLNTTVYTIMKIVLGSLSLLSSATAYSVSQSHLSHTRRTVQPIRWSPQQSIHSSTRLHVATTPSDLMGVDTNTNAPSTTEATTDRTGAMIDLQGILFSVYTFIYIFYK